MTAKEASTNEVNLPTDVQATRASTATACMPNNDYVHPTCAPIGLWAERSAESTPEVRACQHITLYGGNATHFFNAIKCQMAATGVTRTRVR